MTRYIAILALFIGLGGCATTTTVDLHAREQKRKLFLAQALLGENRVAAAKGLLSDICAAPGVPGVTDEALFRLALIDLEPGEQKIVTGKAGKNLEKLVRDYPGSSWKAHAMTIKGLIEAYDGAVEEKAELEKSVRSLKSANLSLTKENKELKQDMEKLKDLELDLERKKKR